MKRRLFSSSLSLRAAGKLLAAVSLALCVATAVLWARSYLVCDSLTLFLPDETNNRSTHCLLLSNRGSLDFIQHRSKSVNMRLALDHSEISYRRDEPQRWEPVTLLDQLGFSVRSG